jgi:phosphoglucomutase
MYERYGYWMDGVQAITLKGKEGIEKIQNTIDKLRAEIPTEIAGYKVLSARDYKLDTIKNMETGEVTPTGLPESNVLYYDLEDGAWVCVRPSGTEPKLKFYYGIKGTNFDDAAVKEKALGEYMIEMVNSML